MDPLESSATHEPVGAPGTVEVGRAIADGVQALLRNLLPALGVALIGVVAYIVAVCTCVGWIVVLPLLLWGMYAFVLQMVDGDAQVATVTSGVQDFGRSFVSMWGLTLLYLLLYLPALGVMVAMMWPDLAHSFATGEPADPLSTSWKGALPMFVWSLVAVRFMLTPFFIVDKGLGAMEAFAEAWAQTSGVWLQLIVLQVVLTLLNLPATVLNVGSQMVGRGVDPTDAPSAQLESLGLQLGLQGVGTLLSVITGLLGLAFFASAYRQLTTAPAEAD